MIDLHHHLLPGLDDGSPDLETSLEMARIAVEDGITHVVCTPHANHRFTYVPETVQALVGGLQRELNARHIPLKLGHGCDFHLTYENITDAKEHPERYSINGKGYLLVEIADYSVPTQLTEIFYQLRLAGLLPILTHPERNPTLQQDHERLAEWIRSGLYVQVTAGSVLGHMGRKAERMAHELLARRWVHMIATDAHNTTSRAPRMQAAFEKIAERYGSEYAHLLCLTNPLDAFEGNPLQPQPEPQDLYEEAVSRSWLQRLLGR